MAIEIRVIRDDEVEEYRQTLAVPFGSDPTPETAEQFRRRFEIDRLYAAFDDGQMVGTIGALTTKLTVPGGQVPMGGTTLVTVLPTHRRQGILRQMMQVHLEEVREAGEPCAGLWASETSIYGRFGYGAATDLAQMTLDKQWAHLRTPVDIRGRVRLVSREVALELFPQVFDRVVTSRPGMLARSTSWWRDRVLHDPPEDRGGSTAYRHAVSFRQDEPVGYVLYRWHREANTPPTIRVDIRELLAVDAEAEQCLWQFLFGTDLVSSFRWWNQPVDDTLQWWLEQPRRAQRIVFDGLWLRLVDVPRALSGRQYSTDDGLTFAVRDECCPWNTGVFRLEAAARGEASCKPVSGPPEISLDVETLSAAYLGGRRFQDLARAGLVEGNESALKRADAMFGWSRQPWNAEIF